MIEWTQEAIVAAIYTGLFLLLSLTILATAFVIPKPGFFGWTHKLIAIGMAICMLTASISLIVMGTTSSFELASQASFFREKSLLGFFGCIGLSIVQYILERIAQRLQAR